MKTRAERNNRGDAECDASPHRALRAKMMKSAFPLWVTIGAMAGSGTGTAVTTASDQPGWRRLTRATVP
jgi:hypothetical protein